LLFQLIATQQNDCEIYNLITHENSTTNCCDLPNVKCNALGRIYYLDLMNKTLKTLPPEIGSLNNLIYLDLENNQLTDLPEKMEDLRNLKYLYLVKNQLNDVPKVITKLQSLEDLDLESNNLTVIPEEIYDLKLLKNLVLNSNKLGSISPSIGKLTNLEKLYLSDVGLNDLPDEIFQLNNLVKLTVSKNNLSSISSQIFNLNLKELYIYDNPNLSIKIINFKTSPITNCDFRNVNILCYQKNTCGNIEEMKEDDLNPCSEVEIEEVKREMENKSGWGYILIFSIFGVLLIVLLILSCIVIKNIFSDKKNRHHEEISNYHVSSGSNQKYPNDYRYSSSAYKNNQSHHSSNATRVN